MKFKLLYGAHVQAHPTEKVKYMGADGKEHEKPAEQVFRARRDSDPLDYAGDIVESDKDLGALFNVVDAKGNSVNFQQEPGTGRKFERLPDSTPTQSAFQEKQRKQIQPA